MILAMAVPAMAADTGTDTKKNAELTITGLAAGDTVKLYQIGTSDANGELTLIPDKDSKPIFNDSVNPTVQEITAVANQIQSGAIKPTLVQTRTLTGENYTYSAAAAGVYLALITSVIVNFYGEVRREPDDGPKDETEGNGTEVSGATEKGV